MEVSDEILSTLGDYASKLCTMDYSTTQPHLIADILKSFKVKGQAKDESSLEFHNWYAETLSWVVCSFAKSPRTNLDSGDTVQFPDQTDDRLTALSCFVAYISVDLVSTELYTDLNYHYRGARITINCIREAVLACFDRLCKNLLIEKCWDAVSLRDSIVKAADFATDYLISQGHELMFEVNENDDYFIFWYFQGTLTGNLGHTKTFSEIEPSSTKNSKDDDDDDDDVVGLKNDVTNIQDRIVGSRRELDIIPIVGMGGIGKTTLARKVYTDQETVIPLFQVRAWIVLSRDFVQRDALIGLLESIAPIPDDVYESDTDTLSEILYRRLKGWRYLIVLDDIWTKEAWNCIKLCFPDDNNGSRIMLTSRVMELASFVADDLENPPHVMNLLSIDDSWKLLRKKVFGKEPCPDHMISIGIQIAEKCQGLPLAIEVISGYLYNNLCTNHNDNNQQWEEVANRVGLPTELTQMESLSRILSISYNDLPQNLKACFITMVNFPKNFKISVMKLVRLWCAMGIFSPLQQPNEQSKTEEDAAMDCFKKLVSRSLIIIRDKKIDGTPKICGIHDLLWDLSMTQFRKEGHYIFSDKFKNSLSIDNEEQEQEDDDKRYVTSISQTLLYFDKSFEKDYPMNSEIFKLLRVLDILNQSFSHFPVEITSLFNLRFLALSTSGNIPESILQLSKLETFVNYHEGDQIQGQVLPREIWLLPNLRHLHVGICTYLPDPTSLTDENDDSGDDFELALLSNLQTLLSLSCCSCTKQVFSNIPNLKEIGIDELEDEDDTGDDELLSSSLENLSEMEKLETLKLYCNPKIYRARSIPEWDSFLPNSIKNLTLSACNLPWNQISGLAMLPNLVVLKLKDNAFTGQEWNMEEDDQQEFLKLKYLSMDWLDLIFWNASSENFPSLKYLRLRGCHNLCRIPLGFGEIYTLELVDLEFCNQVIYQSAIDIEREQINNMGNEKFILRTGRAHPQLQTSGFVMVFIWIAMQINNIFKPKRGFLVRKPRKSSRPKTGKLRLVG